MRIQLNLLTTQTHTIIIGKLVSEVKQMTLLIAVTLVTKQDIFVVGN